MPAACAPSLLPWKEAPSSKMMIQPAPHTTPTHTCSLRASISEWDTCAAHAVVEAAGGEVLQAAGGVRAWMDGSRPPSLRCVDALDETTAVF